MRSNFLHKAAYLPLLALAMGSAGMASPIVSATPTVAVDFATRNAQAEASDLLREVKALSFELRGDADNLEGVKRQSQISWRTHAYHLSYARDHVNEIGKRLARLQEIRASASPWQQHAIDRIVPVAKDVAAHTEAAIQQLNADRSEIRNPIYHEHLTSIQNHTKNLHSSVDAYLDYHDTWKALESTQEKLDQLQEKIGLNES